MLGKILDWLGGGAIKAIGGQINQAYQAKLNAQNDEQRIDADKRIATLEAQRDVLIAEQKNVLTRWIRPAIAFPIVVYIWKLVVWDKVLGLGTTDPLSDELWRLFWIVVGAYFIVRPFEKR